MKRLLFFFFLCYGTLAHSQPRFYTTANAHSHNDYENSIPFYLAYQNGFGSIEADIYSIHDSLFVAHNKQDIRPDRTLSKLYLQPLQRALDSNREQQLILLIDVKDDYKISLLNLEKEITALKKYLSDQSYKRRLTIVVSGNRPPPNDYANYPQYFFFDDDLKLPHEPEQWKRVGLVSLPFYRISRWNAKGVISSEDSLALKRVIDSVHSAKKQIRFWAAPDSEMSWSLQEHLGVDLIGTDRINDLAVFLRRRTN